MRGWRESASRPAPDAAPDRGPVDSDPRAPVFADSLGPGQPLDAQTRQRMESAFGESFEHIQIHNGPEAGEVNRRLSAQALTVGEHVAFAPGNYRPGTPVGDAMLAHELAHSLQQGGGPARASDGAPPVEPVGSALETDADHAAIGAMRTLSHAAGAAPAASFPASRPALRSALRVQRCSCGSPPPATFDGRFRSSGFDPHVEPGLDVFEGRDGQAVVATKMYLVDASVDAIGGTGDSAREWEAGFIQTAREARRVFNYARPNGAHYKRRVTTLPGAHRDGGSEDSPWYSSRGGTRFPDTDDSVTVFMDDTPKSRDDWTIDGGAGRLVSTEGTDRLCTWLVVRHTERHTIIPLNWDTWEIDWAADIDPVAKDGHATGPGGGGARVTDQGPPGDSGINPVLTGASGGEVINRAENTREVPWP